MYYKESYTWEGRIKPSVGGFHCQGHKKKGLEIMQCPEYVCPELCNVLKCSDLTRLTFFRIVLGDL